MGLCSRSFRGNSKLEACLVSDPAHIVEGATGEHVAKIQAALMLLDGAKIERGEIMLKRYGPSTASAVLAYKTKRRIINFTYQTHADNIVGKMTIAALDQEMFQLERAAYQPGACAGKRERPRLT